MNTYKLGSQGNIEDIPALREYTNIFQLMPVDPKSHECGYSVLNKAYSEIDRAVLGSEKVIIHMPYWINLFPNNEDVEASSSCISNNLQAANKYHFRYLITHLGNSPLGGPAASYCVQSAKSALLDLLKVTRGTDTLLLFENQAQNGLDCQTLLKLSGSVNRSMGRKCVGFCFDIEHAYAAGEDLALFDKYISASDVVHFNTVPKSVHFGSFRDFHNAPISDSVGIPPQQYLEWVLRYHYKIKILEQHLQNFVDSVKWVRSQI